MFSNSNAAVEIKRQFSSGGDAVVVGSNQMHLEGEQNCNCSRPRARVTCKRCGYSVNGCRARRPCQFHPKVINLMDLAECPKCRAPYTCLDEA